VYTKLAVEAANTSPTRINATHMCYVETRKSIFTILLPFVRQMLGKESRRRLFFHCAATCDGHLEDLKSYGFKEDNLPDFLGGRWAFNSFDEWLERRIESDREYSPGCESSKSSKKNIMMTMHPTLGIKK
jgi:hypothetical protein